jgi:hypothetical protein
MERIRTSDQIEYSDIGITSQRLPIYGEGLNSKVEKAELTIEKSIIDSVSNEDVSVPKQLLMLQIHKIFL